MYVNLINNFFMNEHSPAIWLSGIVSVTLIALFISLSGISFHPLEAHEAFVLISAQEMHNHQDWVVPWFNGEYRLNKPPMNYWLTAYVAWIAGSINDIQPWHGRLVSALSGVGIVLLTIFNGKKLFDSATGLLAGLMIASSSGFFYYAHSARPEMLYTFFCGIALTAYIYARNAREGGKLQIINGNIIWLAFALATLTKGPHLPGMFLLVFVMDCRLRNLNMKQALTLLQPLSGLIIFMAAALPWWLLLHNRIPASALAHSQVSGSLLSINLLKALNPYYLYRPFQLILPWLFYIPMLAYLFRGNLKSTDKNSNVLLLILIFLVPVLLLSFGPQKRWYYMLPSLMAMFLLLSVGIVAFFRANLGSKIWVKYSMYLFFILPISFIFIVNTPYIFSKERLAEQKLANLAHNEVKLGRKLIVFNITPQIYIYYTKHNVISVHSKAELLTALNKLNGQPVALILQTKEIETLPNDLRLLTVHEIKDEDNRLISLIKIN